MSQPRTNDIVLKTFRTALEKIYGERLQRLVLYGSRARGDARPDSDYDVAVFLKDPGSFWEESGRIAVAETDVLYADGCVINALPFKSESYEDQTVLMTEIRKDGRDL